MDLFNQLSQIDHLVEEEAKRKEQEAMFSMDQESATNFLGENFMWEAAELGKAKKAEEEKLKPLSAGFGPWSW